MTMVKKKRPRQNSSQPPLPGTAKFVRGGYAALGFDVSMTSIAGAGFIFDPKTKSWKGPETVFRLWDRYEHDYFRRLRDAARGYELALDLVGYLKGDLPLEEVYIAVEEPWPLGMQKSMESVSLKQNAQISGAFMGGLIRFGFANVFEINNQAWRGLVAEALGITTHHSKWSPTRKEGKFRAKEWALQQYPDFRELPDMINNAKHGKIEKPPDSKATPFQCHDCYEAMAMASWMKDEIRRSKKHRRGEVDKSA